MATRARDVIFYSTYCQFSRDIVNYIVKKNLKSMFVFIPVETNRDRIPAYIDRVPALVMVSSKRVLFEDDISAYLNEIVEATAPANTDLEPALTSYGDNFALLDENVGSLGAVSGGPGGNFGVYGEDQHIYAPDDDSIATSKDGGGGSSAASMYEAMKNERERDIPSGGAQQRPPQAALGMMR